LATTTGSAASSSLSELDELAADKGALYRTASTTETDYWSDSTSVGELN
jgi:hypothetical protein